MFLPFVFKLCIPNLLALRDVPYIGWKKGTISLCSRPNKLIDYMMAAKPVIHAIEAANDPVKGIDCGISIPFEDPVRIVKAIIELMKMEQFERETMRLREREYLVAHHDCKTLAQEFLSALEQELSRLSRNGVVPLGAERSALRPCTSKK